MSDFMRTSHRGVTLEVGNDPGGYESDGMMTKLPHCSGEGGFGAPGEYKKYPEMRVVHCVADGDQLREVGEDIVDEVSFLPSPSRDSLIAPGGESAAEKAPSKKKVRRKKAERDEDRAEPVVPTRVTFKGPFGNVDAAYESADRQGFMLVLVSNASASFQYSPPECPEPIQVKIGEDEYRAWSSGLVFTVPGTSTKILLLLIEE
jgi:hypothetical protein